MRNKTSKTSFARPVNQLVTVSFAVTFLVVFILSAVLVYRIVDDIRKYYVGAAILLVLYLGIFIISSLVVTGKINGMFAPLDRVSYGMFRERSREYDKKDLKLLAESLKEQNERVYSLSRELNDTKADLDNAFRENRMNREGARIQSQKYLSEVKRLHEKQESINEMSSRMEESLEKTMPLQIQLNEKKALVYDETLVLKKTIDENDRIREDVEASFEAMSECFDQLDGITEAGSDLLESMYNEMTLIQSVASQLNIYAMNTSLDMARAGVRNLQVSGALDEIKQLSAKLSEKTDEMMLQAIQVRNTFRLAKDQTDECRDKSAECRESDEKLSGSFEEISEKIQKLIVNNEDMAGDIAVLTNSVYDMMLLEQKRTREEQKLSSGLKEYGDMVMNRQNVTAEKRQMAPVQSAERKRPASPDKRGRIKKESGIKAGDKEEE